MKKVSFKHKLAVLMLCFVAFVAVALAPDKATAADQLALEVSSVEGKEGDTVTVSVSLTENPGFAGIVFKLYYDAEVLSIPEVWDEDSEEMVPDVTIGEVVSGPEVRADGEGFVGYAYAGSKNSKKTGDLLVIKFEIKEGATIGESSLDLVVESTSDVDENEIAFSAIDGKVTVICEHTETEVQVTKDATCTGTGTKATVCKKCGEVTKTEDIAALGHAHGEYKVTTEPTCTQEGVKTATCSRCEDKVTEKVPALGHTDGTAEVTTEPTCTETGVETTKCTVCGVVTKTEEVAALGHVHGEYEITTEPTCTEEGVKTATCSRCDNKVTEKVPALGHTDGAAEVTTEPTCTETGVETTKCTVCGVVTKTEEVAALGHVHGEYEVTTEPTCTEEGVKTSTCSRCETEVTEAIPALGHKHSEYEIVKEATDTEDGEMSRECTVCHETVKTVIPALGVVAEEVVIKANETEEIKEEYKAEEAIVFMVVGIGMDNADPQAGDIRFVPVKWNIEKIQASTGTSSQPQGTWGADATSYTASYTPADGGNYALNVTLQRQMYTNGEWVADETYISDSVSFSVETVADDTEEKDEIINKGDSTYIVKMLMLAAVAAIGVAVVAKKKEA